jgi:hypothetical protein
MGQKPHEREIERILFDKREIERIKYSKNKIKTF